MNDHYKPKKVATGTQQSTIKSQVPSVFQKLVPRFFPKAGPEVTTKACFNSTREREGNILLE